MKTITMSERRMRLTSVRFSNFKAFKNYSLSLKRVSVLVGPNNSGKSTIIGAFRALQSGLRRASTKGPEWLGGPNGQATWGYSIAPDSLPISTENAHTDYSDSDTTVTFTCTGETALTLFFPRGGGCRLFGKCKGHTPRTPTAFRNTFPLTLGVVPIMGPVEHDEPVLERSTVQRDLLTHRASRHFRNYWHHNPDGFAGFAAMVSRTWPGMAVKPVEINPTTGKLAMFCEENRITRELYWLGSGFQIWCQLLTHISRSRETDLFIVDEPEIYLHPDLQRKLLELLRDAGPDVLVATHSTEIVAEAEVTEIVLIDKTGQSGRRLSAVEGAQAAFDRLGSGQNVVHTQIVRWRRVLFLEGDDLRLLRRFAKRMQLKSLADKVEFASIPLGGFCAWETIPSVCAGIKKSLGDGVQIGCLLDRDYRCDDEIDAIKSSLSKHVAFSHVHHRKELENYLLEPDALQRAIHKAHKLRHPTSTVVIPDARGLLAEITAAMRVDVVSQLIAKRQAFCRQAKVRLDDATIAKEAMRSAEAHWDNLENRLALASGKSVLSDLNSQLQRTSDIALTEREIIDELRDDEIAGDLKGLLSQLDGLAGGSGPGNQ